MSPKKVLMLVLLSAPFTTALSASPLTEEALMRYAQQNSHLIEMQQNQQQAAQTQFKQAGRWADPSFEITQEQKGRSTGHEQEISLWLKQDLKPWGLSDIEKQATTQQNHTEALRLNLRQQDWTLRLRTLFYQALAAEQQQLALTLYHQKLSELALMVEQRWRLGDASKLDLFRIQTELQAIEAQKFGQGDTLQTYMQTLSSLLDRSVNNVDGQLLPKAYSLQVLDVEKNPNLQLMITQTNLNLTHQQAAAKQLYWPDVRVGVGYSQANEASEKTDSFKIGLEMSLPLFSQKQGALNLAHAQVIQAQSERLLLQQTLKAELNQEVASLRQQQTQAQTWQRLIKQQNQPMVTMAQASYQAGELSMLELLDVYRTELTHHKNYLNSAFKAREHYIQLQYLLGD